MKRTRRHSEKRVTAIAALVGAVGALLVNVYYYTRLLVLPELIHDGLTYFAYLITLFSAMLIANKAKKVYLDYPRALYTGATTALVYSVVIIFTGILRIGWISGSVGMTLLSVLVYFVVGVVISAVLAIFFRHSGRHKAQEEAGSTDILDDVEY